MPATAQPASAVRPVPALSRSIAAPVKAVATLVSVAVDNVLGGPATPAAPSGPIDSPAAWALAGAARREFEAPAAAAAAAVAVVPTSARIVQQTAAAAATLPPSPYTGAPSAPMQLAIAALRVVGVVLRALHLPSVMSLASQNTPIISDGIPPALVTGGLNVQSSEYNGWKVWTLTPSDPSGKVVVALHGGGYVGQVNIFQWLTYANMARSTGATVVVPLYPLAPQGTAGVVVPQTADFISEQIANHGAANVSVLGDSAGGQIALSAVQLMVQRGDELPSSMVLLSPVLDNTLTNPNIGLVDDPLLDAKAGYQFGLQWAGDLALTDPLVSPVYGSLDGLPPTWVYSGSMELLSPDALVLQQKAIEEGAPITFEFRKGQMHDWIIFPFFSDATKELPGIYRELGLISSSAQQV